MNHCLFKAKDTKGAVGNTVDYSSLTTKKAAAKNIRLEKNIRIIYYIECIDNDKNTKIVTPSIKGY